MNEIYVRLLALPMTIRGVTVTDDEGDYNIYINSSLTPDQQKLVLKHEMTHIERNDFDSFRTYSKSKTLTLDFSSVWGYNSQDGVKKYTFSVKSTAKGI